MSVLVYIENSEGKIKKASLEAISYATKLDAEVVAISIGNVDESELQKCAVSKVLNANDAKFEKPSIQAYSSLIAEAYSMIGASALVFSKSTLGDAIAGRLAVKLDASLAQNVVEQPEGDTVKVSIFSGKATAQTILTKSNRIFALKKGAAEATEGSAGSVESFSGAVSDADFAVETLNVEKQTGKILLPDAELVVSAGRGLKGPENWGMIEELADTLGAATACSKPVSDVDWRPHSEHVGQTGIKVAPNLYIAIGISGAIQHLAGVNSSKNIVVINTDPEAPFFKAADYGIVGDAFQVVPKLIEALKN